jgi:hypothetical protein
MADRPVLSNPNPFWMVLGTYITARRLHKICCLAEQSQGCNEHVCVVSRRIDRCIYLFIYALTHLAVSSLDNRMIIEYEFESFNKKSPLSSRYCVGIYQEAVLVWRTVMIFMWRNWVNQTNNFQAGSWGGGGGIRRGNVSKQMKGFTAWTNAKVTIWCWMP